MLIILIVVAGEIVYLEQKKFYFAKQIDITTNTQIARNHGRLPEKGFRPSKLATYCIAQQNRKKYKCANVQKCKK